MQEAGVALARDGGLFVGVQPSALPPEERDVTVRVGQRDARRARLAELLERADRGELLARVHAELPLSEVADAHRAVAKGGVRGRYVLVP